MIEIEKLVEEIEKLKLYSLVKTEKGFQLPEEARKAAAGKKGVYLVYDESGRVMYVGKSDPDTANEIRRSLISGNFSKIPDLAPSFLDFLEGEGKGRGKGRPRPFDDHKKLLSDPTHHEKLERCADEIRKNWKFRYLPSENPREIEKLLIDYFKPPLNRRR
jgi:hypothetical protein